MPPRWRVVASSLARGGATSSCAFSPARAWSLGIGSPRRRPPPPGPDHDSPPPTLPPRSPPAALLAPHHHHLCLPRRPLRQTLRPIPRPTFPRPVPRLPPPSPAAGRLLQPLQPGRLRPALP